MSDANFSEIIEKWPPWKSPESRSLLALLDDSILRKGIDETLEKEAAEEFEKLPALIRPPISAGLFSLGGALSTRRASFLDPPELEDIKKKLRLSIEERMYTERLSELRTHPIYIFFEKNPDFRKALRWIRNNRVLVYKGAKAEFKLMVSVFYQTAIYISMLKGGTPPDSLSRTHVKKIITASENLRTALEPCDGFSDLDRYGAIIKRVLLSFEDILKPRLSKNKTRHDKTALKRDFIKGLADWLFIYFDDASPKLIYILAGIVEYDISERNLAKQIAQIKRQRKEKQMQFSAFSQAVHTR